MILLVCGLFVFFLPHLARELGLRDRLMLELGDNRYKALFSLLSAVGLGLIIVGKAHAPFIQLWQPIYELRWLSLAAMIPSIIFVVAANLPTSGIKVRVENPLLLGTTLWSFAHLWSNGDLASLLLFGSFGAWSFSKFLLLPRTAALDSMGNCWDVVALTGGLAVYAVIAVYHGPLFGVGISIT